MKILFVCTGNTCRSPMAAALLKEKFSDLEVQSAGIFTMHGQQANSHAIEALKQEYGIQLTHNSQPVTEALLKQSDLILTMTTKHKRALIMQYPNYQAKYYTLKEYVSKDGETWDQLKALTAEYESKRALYIKEQKEKQNKEPTEQQINDQFKKELTEIKRLETQLMNYDIADPFGRNLLDYKQTLKEINQYLDQLIAKLTNDTNEN